jgi:hypothetical protein
LLRAPAEPVAPLPCAPAEPVAPATVAQSILAPDNPCLGGPGAQVLPGPINLNPVTPLNPCIPLSPLIPISANILLTSVKSVTL